VLVSNVLGWEISSTASLWLNVPPVAQPDTIQRYAWGGVRVKTINLLLNDTDANGDQLVIVGVSSNSAAGGIVLLNDGWVYYTPPPGFTNSDTFSYTVSDGHCEGEAIGVVAVEILGETGQSPELTITRQGYDSFRLSFEGTPGGTYRIECTDSLSHPNWQTLTTVDADTFGVCQLVDQAPTNTPSRFYRLVKSW
jgi:hypothetical protein